MNAPPEEFSHRNQSATIGDKDGDMGHPHKCRMQVFLPHSFVFMCFQGYGEHCPAHIDAQDDVPTPDTLAHLGLPAACCLGGALTKTVYEQKCSSSVGRLNSGRSESKEAPMMSCHSVHQIRAGQAPKCAQHRGKLTALQPHDGRHVIPLPLTWGR